MLGHVVDIVAVGGIAKFRLRELLRSQSMERVTLLLLPLATAGLMCTYGVTGSTQVGPLECATTHVYSAGTETQRAALDTCFRYVVYGSEYVADGSVSFGCCASTSTGYQPCSAFDDGAEYFSCNTDMCNQLFPPPSPPSPPPVTCPESAPSPNSACDGDLQDCSYDVYCCENDCFNTTFASCVRSTWLVSMADVHCPTPDEDDDDGGSTKDEEEEEDADMLPVALGAGGGGLVVLALGAAAWYRCVRSPRKLPEGKHEVAHSSL